MSFIKMNDILVKTGDFFVTFSYSAKSKGHSGFQEIENPILEITPIISNKRHSAMADIFFQILTSDGSITNRNLKEGLAQQFVQGCAKRDIEEFWDTAGWAFLESIASFTPSVTCILYNTRGEVTRIRVCSPIDIICAFKKIEELLFVHVFPVKQEKATFLPGTSYKKELKRDLNRETHKYFLHHRGQR